MMRRLPAPTPDPREGEPRVGAKLTIVYGRTHAQDHSWNNRDGLGDMVDTIAPLRQATSTIERSRNTGFFHAR